jgi:hypothetical protein
MAKLEFLSPLAEYTLLDETNTSIICSGLQVFNKVERIEEQKKEVAQSLFINKSK